MTFCVIFSSRLDEIDQEVVTTDVMTAVKGEMRGQVTGKDKMIEEIETTTGTTKITMKKDMKTIQRIITDGKTREVTVGRVEKDSKNIEKIELGQLTKVQRAEAKRWTEGMKDLQITDQEIHTDITKEGDCIVMAASHLMHQRHCNQTGILV